jgi:hypothetical protein
VWRCAIFKKSHLRQNFFFIFFVSASLFFESVNGAFARLSRSLHFIRAAQFAVLSSRGVRVICIVRAARVRASMIDQSVALAP